LTADRWPISYCTLDRSPLFGLPETLHEQIDHAARAGFTLITPDMFALRMYVDEHGSLEPLAAHLADRGVAVCDIAGANVSADREASVAEARQLADFGATLSAQWVQSRITAPLDDAITLDVYRECAALTAERGVGFGLEFSPFTPINSLRQAREVLDAVRDVAPRQGIVVDTWHLSFADGIDALLDTPGSDVAFVQLSDVVDPTEPTIKATMHQRALPGEGVLDLAGYVQALETIGFDGVVTIEVLSAELRELDVASYVDRTFATTTRLLGRNTPS
jgi:sugar phosphate isomerase/epimerase